MTEGEPSGERKLMLLVVPVANKKLLGLRLGIGLGLGLGLGIRY